MQVADRCCRAVEGSLPSTKRAPSTAEHSRTKRSCVLRPVSCIRSTLRALQRFPFGVVPDHLGKGSCNVRRAPTLILIAAVLACTGRGKKNEQYKTEKA